jgi:hypothetical protein
MERKIRLPLSVWRWAFPSRSRYPRASEVTTANGNGTQTETPNAQRQSGFSRSTPAIIAICAGLSALHPSPARAVEFRAEVDREEIAQDESVSLKLVVEADGTVPVEVPEYSAPQLEEIQSYQGQFVQSTYDSAAGKFMAKFTRSFTYVLRPKTTGRLAISNIRVRVDGKQYTANPITVSVTGGGAGTPPPRGYGGAGSGLRGAGKKANARTLFLRTEVDRTQAYKGQQVVVNYYLYSRVLHFNATADRYPTLPGFLKEELDIPVLTGRLEPQTVTLDGVPYRRVLIASFAAYPLKEGKLTIDPMEVKASYMADRARPGADSDDPFGDEEDLFQHFFQNLAPRNENLRSESVVVDVLPLPPVPKDLPYTGGVGEFDVVSAADRTDLKAHEALTLTLKVEGKGNLSNIETPKISLPDGFELYESKSETKGKAGIGAKIFQYLLIPRKAGDYTLPGIELGFFDPKKGEYVRKTTDPVKVHVNEGDPGAENAPPQRLDESRAIGVPEKESKRIFDLAGDGALARAGGEGWTKIKGPWKSRALLLLGFAVLLALLIRFREALLGSFRKLGAESRRKKAEEKSWEKARRQAEEAQRLPFQDVLKTYDFLEAEIERALASRFGLAARGMTRAELQEALVEHRGFPQSEWQRLNALLEFAETVRFASQAGAVSEDRARGELRKWVAECEALLLQVSKSRESSRPT